MLYLAEVIESATAVTEPTASVALTGSPGLPLWAYVLIGAVAGTVIGFVVLKRRHKGEKIVASPIQPLEKLLEEQLVQSTITGDYVANWGDACSKKHPGQTLVFFIGHVKESTLPMFTSDRSIPMYMNPEQYLFMESVDKATCRPLEVVLVNYSSLDDTIQEYLKNDDYRMILDH